jgi:hypothetical protein
MARRKDSRTVLAWRAVVEISFIVFLFYSNLLMGEFERGNSAGKTFWVGFWDIWTVRNFAIAMVSAVVGFVLFESLREKAKE